MNPYPVEKDCRGHIVVPGDVSPKRQIRMYSNEEIAQALIDGAVTPAGVEDAKDGIRELGLNPDDFHLCL